MNVNIKLIILHVDVSSPEVNNGCLLDKGLLISHSLQDDKVGSELRKLLLEYLEISPDWVKFHLVDVVSTSTDVNVIYACLIPAIIKNKKGQWTRIGEIDDKDTKKMVFLASQKIF